MKSTGSDPLSHHFYPLTILMCWPPAQWGKEKKTYCHPYSGEGRLLLRHRNVVHSFYCLVWIINGTGNGARKSFVFSVWTFCKKTFFLKKQFLVKYISIYMRVIELITTFPYADASSVEIVALVTKAADDIISIVNKLEHKTLQFHVVSSGCTFSLLKVNANTLNFVFGHRSWSLYKGISVSVYIYLCVI